MYGADTLKLPYWHFLNVPHVTDDPSVEFMKEILRIFIGTLEKFTGKKITDEAIAQAVKAHNDEQAAYARALLPAEKPIRRLFRERR